MRLQEMKLGKSLEILIDRDGYHYRLVSKIEDITSDRVCVTLIASRSKVFRFLEEDKVDIVYKDENRLWKWSGVKAGVVLLEDTYVHCFFTQKQGETYNRRETFRVFLGEETKITYYVPDVEKSKEEDKTDSKNEKVDSEKVCEGFIKDISETGVGIFSSQQFEKGEIIEITILSDFGNVVCKGEVVRISDEKHGIYKNYYGIYFTETSKNLPKFIFAQQRLQLQNQRNSMS